jgi:hypothetical protein
MGIVGLQLAVDSTRAMGPQECGTDRICVWAICHSRGFCGVRSLNKWVGDLSSIESYN